MRLYLKHPTIFEKISLVILVIAEITTERAALYNLVTGRKPKMIYTPLLFLASAVISVQALPKGNSNKEGEPNY